MNMATTFTPTPLDVLLNDDIDDDTLPEEIPGPLKELGRLVREILGRQPGGPSKKSLRQAWRNSGVSHTTVSSMANGDKVTMGKIVEFGLGMKADVNALLRAAGYPEIRTEKVDDELEAALQDPEIAEMTREAWRKKQAISATESDAIASQQKVEAPASESAEDFDKRTKSDAARAKQGRPRK